VLWALCGFSADYIIQNWCVPGIFATIKKIK
jgi:hypothetical protein